LAIVSIKELLEAGVHYGHRTSRWNPKMERYIFGKRNAIHIIDLRETVRGLVRAVRFLRTVRGRGESVLLVGTKRQAAPVVQSEAVRLGLPYVTNRWLGGTLTNFGTIRQRLRRLEELEGMEKSGQMQLFSKKMISTLQREKRRIQSNLEGVRTMNRLPGALVVFDPRREHNAVHEANILGIPIVALLDTDSDPDLIDIPIPGNDDALRSIQLAVTVLGRALEEGAKAAADLAQVQQRAQAAPPSAQPKPGPQQPAV
jgi:small subunit ribosomal protein S2